MSGHLKWSDHHPSRGPFPEFLGPLILGLFVAGCQTVAEPPPAMSQLDKGIDGALSDFRFDPAAPLGRVEGSRADPGKVGILDCGLATHVQQSLTLDSAAASGNNVVFSDQTKEIIWFALFDSRGGFANNFSRTYRIEWYSPDGRIFHQQKFKAGFWNETMAKTSLRLATPVEGALIGRWRVRVSKKTLLIDDRYFEIVRRPVSAG